MKSKTILTFIALILLIVSCEKKEANETIKLTAFIGETTTPMPESSTIVGQKFKELTGYEIEMEYLVGDLATRSKIMLASGDLPDFINARNEHQKFRDEGYLIPLEDLIIKHAPNLRNVIGDRWEMFFTDGAEGRHIYAIPDLIQSGKSTSTRPADGWWIQKTILEEAGWPKVTTFEQYFQLIENYLAKNPTINGQKTIGFQLNTDSWYKWYNYENAAERLSGFADSLCRVTRGNGKWEIEPTFFQPDVKRYYKEMNRLYKKGIIDPEGFVNTYDQYQESIATGRVLGTFQPPWAIQEAMDILLEEMPERTYVCLPLVWEDGIKNVYNETKVPVVGMGTSISTSCKDPVAAIKYLDTIIKEDLQMIGYWGLEGSDYYRDENGRVNRTAQQNAKFKNRAGDYYFPVWGGEYYIEQWPAIDGTFSDGTATRYEDQPEIFFNNLEPVEKQILQEMGWETFNSDFTPSSDPEIADRYAYRPLYNIEGAVGSPEQIFASKLENTIRPSAYSQLIMADSDERFEKIWTEFRDTVESTAGYKEWLKMMKEEINSRCLTRTGKANK